MDCTLKIMQYRVINNKKANILGILYHHTRILFTQLVFRCWRGQLPSLQVGVSAVLKLRHENKLQLLGFLHKHSTTSITLKVQPQISSVSPRH